MFEKIKRRLLLIKNSILGRPIMYKINTYRDGEIKPREGYSIVIECNFRLVPLPEHPNCRCAFVEVGSLNQIEFQED